MIESCDKACMYLGGWEVGKLNVRLANNREQAYELLE